jgi:UDP-N-acetylmuramate dehydrogenase
MRYLAQEEVPYMVLGAGTNVLFDDTGFRGAVVRTGSISGFQVVENGSDHAAIVVAAGVPLPSVVSRTSNLGWQGLAPLWGIPGSCGGAIATNAGAGDVCIGDFLARVDLLNEQGEAIALQGEDIQYGYRSMSIPAKHVITAGTLKLKRGDVESIRRELDVARGRRIGKQPLDKPSAGCVFKNPGPQQPAGALLDRLGFKGVTIGDAQVSEAHANFIVNRGNATANHVMELIRFIRKRVKEETDLDLELEIRVMGPEAAHD